MDTIFALATARGRAGVAVVRISGPRSKEAAKALCSRLPPARQVGLREVRGADGELIDQALALVFDAGASFTGEDVVELQLHGSPAVTARVLGELGTMDELRLAQPGEFTRRALENGRMDLTQVEGLADLIDAETEAQRRQALKSLEGALGARVKGWRERLVRASAVLAASIDFSDEELPDDLAQEAVDLISSVRCEINDELRGARSAEIVRDGLEVAIVGRPNLGKSTLLNRLAGREAAITSSIAGTTRDVIEVRMDIGGAAVRLVDTAGLRETTDEIEALGVDRARKRAEGADLRVFLVSEGEFAPRDLLRNGDLVLRAKDDEGAFGGVSGKTGAGVDRLLAEIERRADVEISGAGLVTRERHAGAMKRAAAALENAESLLAGGIDLIEIPAEHLREAVIALDTLLGKVDVENLLDEIFASFCLGK